MIIKTFYCYIDSWPLNCCYMKTTCSITIKFTAFNSDTLSFLNINFLRDQLSFKVTINFIIMIRWCHSCVLWSCKYRIQLKFFQNIKFKWSNDWLLVVTFRIRHCSCAYVYTLLFSMLAPPMWVECRIVVQWNYIMCTIIPCAFVLIFCVSPMGHCLLKMDAHGYRDSIFDVANYREFLINV